MHQIFALDVHCTTFLRPTCAKELCDSPGTARPTEQKVRLATIRPVTKESDSCIPLELSTGFAAVAMVAVGLLSNCCLNLQPLQPYRIEECTP